MATYREFEDYVRSEYTVKKNTKETSEGFMCLEIPCPNDRSHLVFVHPGSDVKNAGEIADIVAMLGELSGSKLEKALEAALNLPLGGLVKINDVIALRHSIPLTDVDESEIAMALLFTAMSADILEAKFVGGDKY